MIESLPNEVRLYQQGQVVWYAQEVLHLILTHLLSLITGTKSYHKRVLRERGNDLGFTHAAQIYLLGIAYT